MDAQTDLHPLRIAQPRGQVEARERLFRAPANGGRRGQFAARSLAHNKAA